jgi:hypothetical protein
MISSRQHWASIHLQEMIHGIAVRKSASKIPTTKENKSVS